MPLNTTPTEDPDLQPTLPEQAAQDPAPYTEPSADPDSPLSFVPHVALESTARIVPLRIRTGRFGALEEHELVRLLDTLEDERARSRFRESVYISVFIWIAIALTALFGPRYLWHAPKLVLPSEVLRQREVAVLTAPSLHTPAPRTTPPPAVDRRTLDHLRATEPRVTHAPSAPTPRPETPQPQPAPAEPKAVAPAQPTPRMEPTPATPNLPATPAPQPVRPRTPAPVVPDAPHPQPSSRPNFSGVPQSASDAMQAAVQGAGRPSGGGSGMASHSRGGAALGMGPAEILSDTQGVNFNPYIRRILQQIYDQWIPLIPEEARPPLSKSGITMVRFSILPDGTIGAMHLDGSTHDDALNKAAWGSITGVGQFPPLPSQFHGPNLELRIHYLVNRDSE